MAKGVTLHQGGGMKSGPPLFGAGQHVLQGVHGAYWREYIIDTFSSIIGKLWRNTPPRTAGTDSARSESGFTFRQGLGDESSVGYEAGAIRAADSC